MIGRGKKAEARARRFNDWLDSRRKCHTQLLAADERGIAAAEQLLSKGEVVAVPTETVYGLAAAAFHEQAVKRIFMAKGRPADNPLIVHVANLKMVYPLVVEVPKQLDKLAAKFWPGPLTIVMKKSGLIPDVVTCGLDTVAIRMPSHPAMKRLIEVCGYPLAAPSANTSGKPSPTTAAHVLDDLDGKIPLILDGGSCAVGVESTVVSLAGEVPVLLRPGAVTLAQLRAVLGEVKVAAGVSEPPPDGEKPLSPGMAHTHYSPKARVILTIGDGAAFVKFCAENRTEDAYALCFEPEGAACGLPFESLGETEDAVSAQNRVFAALRDCDEKGAQVIFARLPSDDGSWLAVYNRLQRSAGFDVRHL